jgi:predicted oxidoreductase
LCVCNGSQHTSGTQRDLTTTNSSFRALQLFIQQEADELVSSVIDPKDFRVNSPGFTVEAREANSAIVALLQRVADEKGATPVQVAFAWLLSEKPWIVPFFGTSRLDLVKENLGAAGVVLPTSDLSEIEVIGITVEAQGARLAEAMLKLTYR